MFLYITAQQAVCNTGNVSVSQSDHSKVYSSAALAQHTHNKYISPSEWMEWMEWSHSLSLFQYILAFDTSVIDLFT